jgi:hypothetical protein
VGRQQSGRTGSHHRRGLTARRSDGQNVLGVARFVLGEKSLDVADSDGPVKLEPFAVELARVGAEVAENAGEGKLLADGLERFAKTPGAGQLNVEVRIDAERAAGFAIGRTLSPTSLEYAVGQLDHPLPHGLLSVAGRRTSARRSIAVTGT